MKTFQTVYIHIYSICNNGRVLRTAAIRKYICFVDHSVHSAFYTPEYKYCDAKLNSDGSN